MRLYTTTEGIAREEPDGSLALVDLPHPDLGALLRDDERAAATVADAGIRRRVAGPDELDLLAPVVAPGRFVIVGLNYHSHVDEFSEGLGIEADHDVGEPFVFDTPGTPAIGPGAPIVRPPEAPDQVDYEGEVALVIGRPGHDVAPADAWSLVAGLTIVDDVSARDRQAEAMTSGRGIGDAKSFPTFKPLGPCLATADGFDLPLDVGLTTRVNGEVRQDDRTTDMIHPLDELLAHITRQMTLQPGDVICTGSPRGVGMWSGGRFLRSGDVVEITVEGIGTLANPVA
ncbi:MAG: fumarylacetoacetate hydrolase family protein [Acidimicrobiales bacterium]|nr:fumarylacetoacetate hydrolase family protein [Acidimicrobiales bacterium]